VTSKAETIVINGEIYQNDYTMVIRRLKERYGMKNCSFSWGRNEHAGRMLVFPFGQSRKGDYLARPGQAYDRLSLELIADGYDN
jgi:hypothetical protein